MDSIGLYIHIPFCRAKCTYCDFNSYAGFHGLFDDYALALAREMEQEASTRVRTLYLGGGTPTVLPLAHLARILESAHKAFAIDPDAEVSLEANPGTVDATMLAGLRALGVNRLSLGVQSFSDSELRLLGRIHTASQAAEALRAARRAGLASVNLDLIYGLPGQTLAAWRATLERTLSLEPDHLSLYALSVEEGTPLARQIGRGDCAEPDADLAADMYELAEETLAAVGYLHYEISNWAQGPAHQCRHNQIYWRNEPYLGLGAGAHSWDGSRRWSNVGRPETYVARLFNDQDPVEAKETIDCDLEVGETMMMGLRLLEEGVTFERFRARFGKDLRSRFATELAELSALGLVEIDDTRVRLSRGGRLLGNQVFYRFLPA
jgi:oxygen-independent coproporphyrinogen-3 oxidase